MGNLEKKDGGSIIDGSSIFPRCSPLRVRVHVRACVWFVYVISYSVPMFALTCIPLKGYFFFSPRIREVGKRGTRSKGQPGLSDLFASPISPITYLFFSSTSFFAGVCSAGKETGERSGIREKNRGQRKGVCEKVSFVAGGETDLQAPGQDAGEKH